MKLIDNMHLSILLNLVLFGEDLLISVKIGEILIVHLLWTSISFHEIVDVVIA
jgi:hypothetical protein